MAYYKNTIKATDTQVSKAKINFRIVILVWCFVAASVLWLLIALNNTYDTTLTYTLYANKIKKNVVVHVRGKGFELLKEKFADKRIQVQAKSVNDSESYIRNNLPVNEHIKYLSFQPKSINF